MAICNLGKRQYLMRTFQMRYAGVAQLVERHLAKVAVDGSSPFARSMDFTAAWLHARRPFCFPPTAYCGLRTSKVNSRLPPS